MDDPGARPDPLAVPESGQSGQRVTRLALPDKAPRQDPHRAALRAGAGGGFGLRPAWDGHAALGRMGRSRIGAGSGYWLPHPLRRDACNPDTVGELLAGVLVIRQRLVDCRVQQLWAIIAKIIGVVRLNVGSALINSGLRKVLYYCLRFQLAFYYCYDT